jgi:hypothetical protein
MKALLKLNKSIIAIVLFTSLCFVNNYSYAQGLLGKIKKTQDDIKKTTDEAKKIKNDAKNVTGAGSTGNGGSNSNSGSNGSSGTSGTSVASTSSTILSNEKYYRITNVATGQALTLVYDLNKAQHTAIYAATIELKPVDNTSDAQQWFLYHESRSASDDEEIIYTKVGYNNGSGYTMWLGKSDSSNNPSDKINYLYMYLNQNTSQSLWHFQKLSNGFYRIFSHFSMPNNLNKRFEEQRDRWNEARSFQAVTTVGGKTTIKQMKNADIDAQYWKLEELDYIPVSGR